MANANPAVTATASKLKDTSAFVLDFIFTNLQADIQNNQKPRRVSAADILRAQSGQRAGETPCSLNRRPV
jgi:hypothetical protein